ncbi:MAG: hypothetical protein ACREDF_11710 [Thermoplasmata archaeon]
MAAGKQSSPWMRRGNAGSNAIAPGSYGGYYRQRRAPSSYPTTPQQRKVGQAGREVGKQCKGKKGSDFFRCRHDAIAGVFGLPK